MTDTVLEYYRVLQEESKRICGVALPVEIVRNILFQWGGLQTPSGRVFREWMVRGHNGHKLVPWPCAQTLGVPQSHVHLVDPSPAVDTLYAVTCWLRPCPGTINFFTDGFYLGQSELVTISGPRLRYGLNRWAISGLGHPYSSLRIWRSLGNVQLWRMAATARGVPHSIVKHVSNKMIRGHRSGVDMYQLVLRAETDYTWRFWWDLWRATSYDVLAHAAKNAGGIVIGVAAICGGLVLFPLDYAIQRFNQKTKPLT